MKSNMKLGFVGLLVCSVLGAAACLGQTDPPPEAVGEAKQKLVTCSSDCSGVPNSEPFSMTCQTSCTATNAQITCDGTVTPCPTCVANMGQSCRAELCHCCKASRWLEGTIDCYGVCQTNDYCCCDSCLWC
jgi:hypothetical protein